MEQLRKVLQSLMEFYKDARMSSSHIQLSNETEFRGYYSLVFLRDHDVSRQLQTLPDDIFFSSVMMRCLRLRSLVQRGNGRGHHNAEATPNSFARFFKKVRLSATYLEACVLETWFGSIRTAAFKAMRQALGVKAVQISQVPVSVLVSMLAFDDVPQLVAFCNFLGLELVDDEQAVWFKRSTSWEGIDSVFARG
jgi:SAC3/GANP family